MGRLQSFIIMGELFLIVTPKQPQRTQVAALPLHVLLDANNGTSTAIRRRCRRSSVELSRGGLMQP